MLYVVHNIEIVLMFRIDDDGGGCGGSLYDALVPAKTITLSGFLFIAIESEIACV